MKTSGIKTLSLCNNILEKKMQQPLIRIIDLSQTEIEQYEIFKEGFYSIILKEYDHNQYRYGRKNCDYSDATALFFSPNDTIEIKEMYETPHGRMLFFHPALLLNYNFRFNINDYHFFSFYENESLHLSQREKSVFIHCLNHIEKELQHVADQFSLKLIGKSVELLLDYSKRFYDRQFILRYEENIQLINKLEKNVGDYYGYSKASKKDIPQINNFANLLNLSPAYLSDLLENETGYAWNEYIQSKHIEIAKSWLRQSEKSVKEIATNLGYPSTEYFRRLFKKLIGLSPSEYRLPN